MRAGALRHRVLIEQGVETTSVRGMVQKAWVTFLPCWAAIEPVGAKEIEQAKALGAQVTHRITIRYQAGVTNKMRVNYTQGSNGARYFDIRGFLNPEERRRELDLLCVEQQA